MNGVVKISDERTNTNAIALATQLAQEREKNYYVAVHNGQWVCLESQPAAFCSHFKIEPSGAVFRNSRWHAGVPELAATSKGFQYFMVRASRENWPTSDGEIKA